MDNGTKLMLIGIFVKFLFLPGLAILWAEIDNPENP
jgi:hypothetical protein